MSTAPMQVSLVKGGTKLPGQDTLTLQVLGTAPSLMDGNTKPTVNNLTAAPTQADFNNLLAALRTRGVIGGS